MVKMVNGIPIFERPKIKNEPFMLCVARCIKEIASRVTKKSPNSFLFVASDGKDIRVGAGGNEENIIKGLVSLLDSNEPVRKLLLTHYTIKQQKENGRTEEQPGAGAEQPAE
jgi:hypothetical protein